MSTPINDGGPAFPREGYKVGDEWADGQPGMSLRAYLAGQALAGLVANKHVYRETYDGEHPWRESMANDAVKLADALIARLEQP